MLITESQKTEAVKKLFVYLFEQGFLTSSQMKEVSGLEWNDIQRLIREDYVKAEKSFFYPVSVYLPREKAKRFLKENGVPIYVNGMEDPPEKNELHDRWLTDIRIEFERMGYREWQSEKCLRQRGMRRFTPDAIVTIGKRKIAIELELTGKGNKPYERKLGYYGNHPAIYGVLYFIAQPKLAERFRQLIKSQNHVYFTLLNNFADYRGNAYVESGKFVGEALQLWRFLERIKNNYQEVRVDQNG